MIRILWARALEGTPYTAIVFEQGGAMLGGLAVMEKMTIDYAAQGRHTWDMRGDQHFIPNNYATIDFRLQLHKTWSVSSVEEFYQQEQWRQVLTPLQQQLEGPR